MKIFIAIILFVSVSSVVWASDLPTNLWDRLGLGILLVNDRVEKIPTTSVTNVLMISGLTNVRLDANVTRQCTVNGQLYLVMYQYTKDGAVAVPATPEGQPHYPCLVTVYKIEQVGKPFAGTVTENGCWEDIPEDMVKKVLKEEKK
jgi:hypothetical protein